jgi:hypothetical protein
MFTQLGFWPVDYLEQLFPLTQVLISSCPLRMIRFYLFKQGSKTWVDFETFVSGGRQVMTIIKHTKSVTGFRFKFSLSIDTTPIDCANVLKAV